MKPETKELTNMAKHFYTLDSDEQSNELHTTFERIIKTSEMIKTHPRITTNLRHDLELDSV